MTSDSQTTAIAAAALSYEGDVWSLPAPARHHDVIRDMVRSKGVGAHIVPMCVQGFVTTDGTFVGRHAAVRIAETAGQIIKRTAPAHGLFSEDVW